MYYLNVWQDGNVYRGICGAEGTLGNANTGTFKLPSKPVKCPFDTCDCSPGIHVKKVIDKIYNKGFIVTNDVSEIINISEKNINQLKILKAILISFSFIYLTNLIFGVGDLNLNLNFFISVGVYTILSFIALYGYELNKLVGFILFFSITFLSPNLYPELEGQLFPVTYVIFALFLTYFFGNKMYKTWKTSI